MKIYFQAVPGSGVGCEQHQIQMIKVVPKTQCSGGDGDIMKLLHWLLALPPSYIQSNQSVHIYSDRFLVYTSFSGREFYFCKSRKSIEKIFCSILICDLQRDILLSE